MADTLVYGTTNSSLDEIGLWGPYWSDIDTAVIVYVDSASDISFARTINKGASWAITQIEAGAVVSLACWYDKETPGDTGTLIHIAWLDFDTSDAYYITVDVADGSQGTKRTIDAGITVGTWPFDNRIAITKTVNGNLLVAFSTQTEIECYRSVDAGVNWVDRADVFETATEEDWVLLFPANIDAGDACAIFWDRSTNEILVKMYDDSANTWTETAIAGPMYDDSKHINMDASVRHSDNHILLAFHSNDDQTSDDLHTFDLTVDSIASPTVTAKTNIFLNQGESAQVAVFINQQTDDVYVAYLKGNPTWQATVDVVFHISTNGMGAWGGEQAYSESVPGDFRLVFAGRTVGDAGGRYQPAFYDDDDVDIYINETNDVEIAAVVGTDPPTEFAGTRVEHSDLSTYKLKQEVVGY